MIDHAQNPNADTGLFVKIDPEEFKPVNTEQYANRLQSTGFNFAPPKMTANERHQKRMDKLKNRLIEIQLQVKSGEKLSNRYLGYNRDNLMMTTILSTDGIVDSSKTAETPSETIVNNTQLSPAEKITKLKNMYSLQLDQNSLGGSAAQPDDDNRGRWSMHPILTFVICSLRFVESFYCVLCHVTKFQT